MPIATLVSANPRPVIRTEVASAYLIPLDYLPIISTERTNIARCLDNGMNDKDPYQNSHNNNNCLFHLFSLLVTNFLSYVFPQLQQAQQRYSPVEFKDFFVFISLFIIDLSFNLLTKQNPIPFQKWGLNSSPAHMLLCNGLRLVAMNGFRHLLQSRLSLVP